MLSFPDDYFRDEVREGFLVSEMMKRTWGAQLEIFDRIRNLCERYGLKYYAEVGTLLGAVRHKGIIPWDDDIDIAMLREDYNKFLQHEDELGEDLCLRSIYSSDTFCNFHAIATHKADILEWDDERMRKNHGCPFICSVDIFPLDYYPNDAKKFEDFRKIYSYSYGLLYKLMDYEQRHCGRRLQTFEQVKKDPAAKEICDHLKILEELLANHLDEKMILDKKKNLRNQLARITDRIAQAYSRKDAVGVDYAPKMPLGIYSSRPVECYDGRTELDFEVTKIAVPSGYSDALRSIYGENYMTPVLHNAGHDYPFFKQEVNVLVGGDIGERYVVSVNKKHISDSIDILNEAHDQLIKLLTDGNLESALALLGQMQELAVEIGNFTEKTYGEGSKTVDALSDFCEDVYEIYKDLEVIHVGDDVSEYSTEYWERITAALGKSLLMAKRAVYRDVHGDIPKLFQMNKRYVLVGLSAAGVVNNSYREIDSVKRLIQQKLDDGDAVVLAFSGGAAQFMEKTGLEIRHKYYSFLDEMGTINGVEMIKDPSSEETDALLAVCDKYYGDDCRLSRLCSEAGIEVNILNYDLQ